MQQVAGIHYNEGIRLLKLNTLADTKAAVKTFYAANKSSKGYKDCLTKLKEAKTQGAEILYNKACEKEKTLSFNSQLEAANYYKQCNEWVANYKNCCQKQNNILKACNVKIIIADNSGKPKLTGSDLKLPKYFKYLKPSELSKIKTKSLNNQANYKTIEQSVGRFITFKTKLSDNINYTKDAPVTQTRTVKAYYAPVKQKGSDKYVLEKVSKKDYDASLTAHNIIVSGMKLGMGKLSDEKKAEINAKIKNIYGGINHIIYTGKVTKTTESGNAVADCIVEVWEYHKNGKPTKLTEIRSKCNRTDKIVNEVYSGNEKAKPKSLIKAGRKLKTKEQLVAELRKSGLSSTALINEVAEELSIKIKQNTKFIKIQ
jgi:hypothetical protein